ncbi:D-alanyl-D-alanine carboxypeptidase family protein [Lacimicrobium alkaliphilum]|uniref:Peptidase S11 D-alanyl-D-alanine carboxypeptidase A N-terminal domain-containing protein n=1 Tax=Lacimicrobium alkaliphilum TaxID=1526571 RepID=A0A0U3B2T4_9ALTE|nr:serine hydrolase [Lacimicrobium alkaliphilum]ALS99544.1 hypothetical protein AT746_15615 [Lacimicrobium alkaliphilum]
MLQKIKTRYWNLRAKVRAKSYQGLFSVINFAVWCRHLPDLFASRRCGTPEISARSACCIDVDSGKVVAQKNHHFRYAPASIVKLATALVLVSSGKLLKDEYVTIEASDVAEPVGSSMKLKQGDIVSYLDLLYGMLLASGNDAARATARAIGQTMLQDESATGDPTIRFVAAMNELADSLGMKSTRFCNPSGQDLWRQYSTACDLAILASAAFSNPVIQDVISVREHIAKIQGDNARDEALLSTLDNIDRTQVVGGKTGTTINARACLALLLKQRSGERVVIVTLGSELDSVTEGERRITSLSRYKDMEKMIEHVQSPGTGFRG